MNNTKNFIFIIIIESIYLLFVYNFLYELIWHFPIKTLNEFLINRNFNIKVKMTIILILIVIFRNFNLKR